MKYRHQPQKTGAVTRFAARRCIAAAFLLLLLADVVLLPGCRPSNMTQPPSSIPTTTAPTVPTEADLPAAIPGLTIHNGNDSLKVMVTSYDWYTIDTTDFKEHHFKKDHRDPMAADGFPAIPHLSAAGIATKLEWIDDADSTAVRCWPAAQQGDPHAYEQFEIATIVDNEIQLREGTYIYEVEATWYWDTEGYGTVFYVFAATCSAVPGEIEKAITITCGSQRVTNATECIEKQVRYDDAGHTWLSEYGLSGYETLQWNLSVVTIPEMTLQGDVQVTLPENGTLERISVYKRLDNQNFEFSGNKASLAELANLPEGSYYLVLRVNWKGRYIQEQDAYETCLSDYLVLLHVPDKGEPKMQWHFDEQTGTLTVYGMEQLPDYTSHTREDQPWKALRDQIKHIVIADGTKRIGDHLFYSLENLQSVSLPEGLEEIGEYAFADALHLSEIHFPTSLKVLDSGAFARCHALKSIILPIHIETVGHSAFADSSGLQEVTVYGSPKVFNYPLFGCTALQIIRFCGDYPQDAYYSLEPYRDYVVYYPRNNPTWPDEYIDSSSYNILWAASDDPASEVVVPGATSGPCGRFVTWHFSNGVLTISGHGRWHHTPWAAYKKQIREVILTPGLINIASAAFYGCEKLEKVSIPDTIVELEVSCFQNCSSLASIELPKNMTLLGGSVFFGCSSLTSIYIPEGVSSIGNFAFNSCAALSSVHLPPSLTEIGDGAFGRCTALKELTFPSTLKRLGESCFVGCSNLKKMYFYGDPPTVGNFTFNGLVITAYYPPGNVLWETVGVRNPTGMIIKKPDQSLATEP